ncbi:hypothetical protein L6R52_32960 [Myxococcota bacterium]|nr:hypothetical protein [Myxococcota bacterium]
MLTQKDIAEVYRLGLTIGLFEVKEVVAWADGIIAASDNPDFGLIEVSMAGDVNEGKMAQLLREVGGDCDAKVARGVIYGLLAKKLAADASAADTIGAQVKAIQRGEGVDDGVTADNVADYTSRAADWQS